MSHALLSPSAASKWMNCPPSARIEATIPDSESSYAAEGTLAHNLSYHMLRFELGESKAAFKKAVKAIKENELYTEEMYDYCSEYVAIVMNLYQEAKQKTPDALIYLEQKFDLSEYIPEGFGTIDVVIIADHRMYIIDLKYGKGVPVSSENNKQLLVYALGALKAFSDLYDINEVSITIVQPRIDNTSTSVVAVNDLFQWGNDILKPAADLAFKGEGEFNPGNHCQFCKVRPQCRAHRDMQMEIAASEFKDPPFLDDNEIVEILNRAKFFENWITAVKEFALDHAVNHGKQWAGMKLVEGRANRKYADELAVLSLLEKNGFDKEDIGRYKLFGITEMEKELGKKKFTELLTPLIIKPKGKPALAPEDDKRPAFNSADQAVQDFSD